MDSNYLPQTVTELENWMNENGYHFNSYSINGNSIDEGFGIQHSGALFVWYYTERGQKKILQHFQSEAQMVAYAYNQIKADKWARTHCIGCSTDFNKIKKLKQELQELKIKFFDDSTPCYGPNKPVYRVFVLGCDIQKTIPLKEKYGTGK